MQCPQSRFCHPGSRLSTRSTSFVLQTGSQGSLEKKIDSKKTLETGEREMSMTKQIKETLTVIDFERVLEVAVSSQASIQYLVAICAGEGEVEFSVELSEVGKCRRPHPDNQVFVLQPVVVNVILIQLPKVLCPRCGLGIPLKLFSEALLVFAVTGFLELVNLV